MRTLIAMTASLVLVLGTVSFASAVDPAPVTTQAVPVQTVAPSTTKVVNNTTAAIGMGLSVLGIGIGLGLIGFAALSGIARQPEQAGAIQGAMFIIAGLVEGAGIISLVLCLVTIFV